jgi:predicted GNAT family acetyltransferase
MVGGNSEVTNNNTAHRYELTRDGELSLLAYELRGERIILIHTEVPIALEGQGIGGTLARAALEDAKARSLKVVPVCEFVQAYLVRHTEYLPLVELPQR